MPAIGTDTLPDEDYAELPPPQEENIAAAPQIWLRPMEGEIGRSMGYSYDETHNDHRYHHGVDIMAEPGTAVRAAAEGIITVCNEDAQWGGVIIIDHGGGWQTVYRCIAPAAAYGDNTAAGDIIGHILEAAPLEGAAEAHLHFEMYIDGTEANPAAYI